MVAVVVLVVVVAKAEELDVVVVVVVVVRVVEPRDAAPASANRIPARILLSAGVLFV